MRRLRRGVSVRRAGACALRVTMSQLQFFSSWFCPYAQRAWIALEELGVAYEWVEIQPYRLRPDGSASKNPKTIEQKRLEFPGFVESSPKGLASLPISSSDSPRIVMALGEKEAGGVVVVLISCSDAYFAGASASSVSQR